MCSPISRAHYRSPDASLKDFFRNQPTLPHHRAPRHVCGGWGVLPRPAGMQLTPHSRCRHAVVVPCPSLLPLGFFKKLTHTPPGPQSPQACVCGWVGGGGDCLCLLACCCTPTPCACCHGPMSLPPPSRIFLEINPHSPRTTGPPGMCVGGGGDCLCLLACCCTPTLCACMLSWARVPPSLPQGFF